MCAYILFPEILGTDRDKYQNLALWLCSRHSVISPNIRDSFTAGGQVEIYLNGERICYKAPRVLANFLSVMSDIRKVFDSRSDVFEEISYYSSYSEGKEDVYKEWKCAVLKYLQRTLGTKSFPLDDIFNMQVTAESHTEMFVETY